MPKRLESHLRVEVMVVGEHLLGELGVRRNWIRNCGRWNWCVCVGGGNGWMVDNKKKLSYIKNKTKTKANKKTMKSNQNSNSN